MKKKLLITLQILVIIFLILLIIQVVDEKINGDDYKNIQEYSKNINKTIKSDTSCLKDLDKILEYIVNDDSKLNEYNLDDKINACYALSTEIEQIPIPAIKNKNKSYLINELKKEFADSFSGVSDFIKTYRNCPDKNSSSVDQYKLSYLKNMGINQSKLVINSIDVYLTYSIKDIFITRPLLLYTKFKLTPERSLHE